MDQTQAVQLKIEDIIDKGNYTQALELVEQHKALLMSSSDIKPVMRLLKKIPQSYFIKTLHKLIMGWTSFLCGENLALSQMLAEIHEKDLTTPVESSLFYGLKALTTFMHSHKDGLKYARLSVDVLDPEENRFYYANAKLTYGQLLGSAGDNQQAAHEFFTAYHLFKAEKSYFPAVVSLVNYGLKKHALGEVTDILEAFQKELMASSSTEQHNTFFDILKLPLGIAFFELNKQELAVSYLESAKKAIYGMAFVHMFGVLEMHLTLAYAALKRYDDARGLLGELSARLGKLHYDKIMVLCSALYIQINLLEGKPINKSDQERLEVEYLINGSNTSSGTVLALTRLKLSDHSINFDASTVIQCHSNMVATGNIPGMLTTAILAAEYCYQIENLSKCQEYLQKAVSIYHQYKLSARFFTEKAECLKLLKDLEPGLYQFLYHEPQPQAGNDALTQREIEILQLIATGLSNEEISNRLYIGIGTTKWHINNIFSKLSVKRRAQAIAQAQKMGILKNQPKP